MELIIPNKLLWLPSLYLTHQEKNKLKCIQWCFWQFGKLLLDKMDCLNEWNKRVKKVKWEKPKVIICSTRESKKRNNNEPLR